MRYPIIVLALLGVLASPRPAAAADTATGSTLLELCPGQMDTFCIGYPSLDPRSSDVAPGDFVEVKAWPVVYPRLVDDR